MIEIVQVEKKSNQYFKYEFKYFLSFISFDSHCIKAALAVFMCRVTIFFDELCIIQDFYYFVCQHKTHHTISLFSST